MEQSLSEKSTQRYTARSIEQLSSDLKNIDTNLLSQNKLSYDELAELCAYKTIEHYEWSDLAGRLKLEALKTKIWCSFSEITEKAKDLLHPDYISFVAENKVYLDSLIDDTRDDKFNWFGVATLMKSYLLTLHKNIIETPQHMFLRVATWIWKPDLVKIKSTYDDLSMFNYMHATPTLFNSGVKRPQLSSCFLMTIPDSLDGISKSWKDCAIISQGSGGIGLDVTNIRHSEIGNTKDSSGIVPMLKVHNNIMMYVDQAKKRKGSAAIYLSDHHIDIFEFLELKKPVGAETQRARDLFYALWISDLFMERVRDDEIWSLFCPNIAKGLNDVWGKEFKHLYETYEKENKFAKQVKARDLWQSILVAIFETGVPYILFKDACNRKSNQRNLGTIRQSNLCVSGDTKVLTNKGYYPIESLKDTQTKVWNGFEFSTVTIKQTNVDQSLLRVQFSNGAKLRCTPYHKFYVSKRYSSKSFEENFKNPKITEVVEAKDLKIGMKLVKHNFPIVDSEETMNYPYTHGFFCGDGTYANKHRCSYKATINEYCKRHAKQYEASFGEDEEEICKATVGDGSPVIALYGEKKDLVHHITKTTSFEDSNGRIVCLLPKTIDKKFKVPINCSIETKLRWFEGICDSDGTVCKQENAENIQITSINPEFLNDIRLMLSTLGIDAKICLNVKEGLRSLPDGKGGHKQYECKTTFRILISGLEVQALKDLGFSPKRLKLRKTAHQNRQAKQFVKIVSVTPVEGLHDTFCFNEPIKHSGIFNGVMTSNCTEILEFTSKDEIANCNLASIVLSSCVKKFGTSGIFDFNKLEGLARKLVRNLNSVIDINYYPDTIPEIKRSNLKHRPLGIGVQGLADTFALMDITWESQQAKDLNRDIFECIYYASIMESCAISKEKLVEKNKKIETIKEHIKTQLNEALNFSDVSHPFETSFSNQKIKQLMKALEEAKNEITTYESFSNSPASKGFLQHDLWAMEELGIDNLDEVDTELVYETSAKYCSKRYNWDQVRYEVKNFGLYNSLLIALMPTASTAHLTKNTECFEAFFSLISSSTVLAGQILNVIKYLVDDLKSIGLWNSEVAKQIALEGSIQNLQLIDEKDKNVASRLNHIKAKYKTVYELPLKTIAQMGIDRGRFVCQSQSFNCFMKVPDYVKLTSFLFFQWDNGAKTGMYYLRSAPAAEASKLAIKKIIPEEKGDKKQVCTDEVCVLCQS